MMTLARIIGRFKLSSGITVIVVAKGIRRDQLR
jgi:hypothetical protein